MLTIATVLAIALIGFFGPQGSQGTVPPLLILLYASGKRRAINWLWAGALFWPVSLLISQVTNYVDNQYWYGDYLTDYPILGFTDIALPLILMYLWTRLRVLPRD